MINEINEKTIVEKDKWKEVIEKVTIYTIKKIDKKPISLANSWVESVRVLFNTNSIEYKKRMSCNYCKKVWSSNKPIYIVYMDKGNKLVCGDCRNKLEKNSLKTK